jgi:TrmH family RNA methyltransferase
MITKSQVKYIQSLGQKKLRDAEAVFVAEGPKIINELIAEKRVVLQQVFGVSSWIEHQRPLLAAVAPTAVVPIEDFELEKISFLQTPHDCLAVFKKPALPSLQLKGTVTLVLDGIQDPGNMGTLLRIADWFGISQVVCSADSADAFAPKSVQASMGSIARTSVWYCDLEQLAAESSGISFFAATLHGKPITSFGKIKEGFIVIGNESKGVREGLLARCDQQLTIPRRGSAESLNAAVATGIILSHLLA